VALVWCMMKYMKKIMPVLTIGFSLFVLSGAVFAQARQGAGGQTETVVGNRGIEAATGSLNRVVARRNSDAVGEQVRTMVQSQEKVQVRTKTALHQMDQRGEAMKLMIGPDYKSADQVRGGVVSLRNDIVKLEELKDEVLPSDIGDVQGAIDGLQVEADELEVQLAERVSGFSLFGWLARLLAR